MRGLALGLLAILVLPGCFAEDRVTPADYLTADEYRTWVIEVDYASGHRPSDALLSFVRDRLAARVHKDVVEFRMSDVLGNGNTSWSDRELPDFAASQRDIPTGDGTVVTHLLFLAGHSEHDTGNQRVLGAAIGHDLIVIFSQSIRTGCQRDLISGLLCSQPDAQFRSVLMHEFGHALGLVNNGVPMVTPHEASDCAGRPDRHHSTNRDSVMYCQVESSTIFALFGSNPPTDFDAQDRADLKAAGGR